MFLFFKVMNLLITEIIMMIIYTKMIFHKTSVVIRCQSEKLCKDLVHVKKTSYHSNRSVGKVHLILALNHRLLSYL